MFAATLPKKLSPLVKPATTTVSLSQTLLQLCHHRSMERKAFVVAVSDRLTRAVLHQFHAQGFACQLFEGVDGSLDSVWEGAGKARLYKPGVIVGVGDGRCIDGAKLLRLKHDNPEVRLDRPGVVLTPTPLVAVGTLSSAGVEMSPSTQHIAHRGIRVGGLLPDLIVRDTRLLALDKNNISFPGVQTLLQGMEALFAREDTHHAMGRLFFSLEHATRGDPLARESVFSAMGEIGRSVGRSGVGAATAMALKLEGLFGVPLAIGLSVFFPHVMDLHLRCAPTHTRYNQMARVLGVRNGDHLLYALMGLREKLGIPRTLRGLGMDEDTYHSCIPEMADAVLREAVSYPLTREEIVSIYQTTFA